MATDEIAAPEPTPAPAPAADAEARPVLFLAHGGDKRLKTGHPWIYSNEVRMDADAKALPPGSVVELRRVDGKPLGVASFNPHSLIAARLLDDDPKAAIDAAWVAERVARAGEIRERLYPEPFYRLVHGEADGLPGFVIDRFDEALVIQPNSAGAERLLPEMYAALAELVDPGVVVLRADSPARRLEGLESFVKVVHGELDGPIEGAEGELLFAADLAGGQKTGWFYDQRDNRAFAARFAEGADVLDLYCYAGGFGVSAARAGARSVTGVDSAQAALDLAEATAEINGVGETCAWLKGDVFKVLEEMAAEGRRFGLVIADPPAFAKSRKDLKAALRGYRKLARLAAEATAEDGYLFLASCSHHVSPDALQAEISRGLAAAGRRARLLRASGAGADHPVHPALPESAYLKGLMLALD